MSTVLTVTLIGMVVIAAIGFLGRRKPDADLAQWAVGGRKFGSLTMWFLQAGETFTTFTFLGMAGLAFTNGVAATYAIPYIPLGTIALYFIGPRVWRLGRRHHYLTQGDYFEHRFQSKGLSTLVAVVGVVFMLPYLQLQITGLGQIVQLVTHNGTSGTLGMVIGTVLTAAFVLWAGIRGAATTSYFKDAVMLIAVVVVVIAVPLHFTGGIGHAFQEIAAKHPEALSLQAGDHDKSWWFTSMLSSTIGAGFLCFPFAWPGLMGAGNERGLRRNWVFGPLYQITLIMPIAIGFIGILVLSQAQGGVAGNGVLLTLTGGAMPEWLIGVIAVGGSAAAMVPAAVMSLGMSTAVARNVVRAKRPRTQMLVNHVTVLVALGLALVLQLVRPGALANLLLLTYAGIVQVAPGLVAGLRDRPLLHKASVISGIVAGVGVVIWLSFWTVDVANINPGIVGLAANLLVAAAVQAVIRRRPVPAAPDADAVAKAAVATAN
jgi:SSS family solute:Na+ symporter